MSCADNNNSFLIYFPKADFYLMVVYIIIFVGFSSDDM